MSYNQQEKQDLPNEGDFDGYANSPTIRVVNVSGERKCIIECAVPIDGRLYVVDSWNTLDMKAKTASGKNKIDFTITALEALGATDPLGDIAAALAEDRSAAEIHINGITGEGAKWATINAKRGNQGGMFYNVYPKREPIGDDFLKELQSYQKKNGVKKKPAVAVDPFAAAKIQTPPARAVAPAPAPMMGAPAPARPQPITPAVEEDTSFDPAKLSAPAEEPAIPPASEYPAGGSHGGGSSGKKKKGAGANVIAE